MGELYLDNIERHLDISQKHPGMQKSRYFERVQATGSYRQPRAARTCYLEREDLQTQER